VKRTILLLTVIAGLGAFVAANISEIKRYMAIRRT
jgi:hypothetical protein